MQKKLLTKFGTFHDKNTHTQKRRKIPKYNKSHVYESCSVMSESLRPRGLVDGILQDRILEWVALPFSRRSSPHQDQTQVSHVAGGFFTI